MTRTAASGNVKTYVPDDKQDLKLVVGFVSALEAADSGAAPARPVLVAANGERFELPETMYAVLRQVAEALSSGMGVTVAPMNAMLTTQEAADFLGVARPTLVRMLDRGDLPMERPGRHRFVQLKDLVEFQQRERVRRREALQDMSRQAEELHLPEATDRPAPATR
jgi:excisionase family DNA binding protein